MKVKIETVEQDSIEIKRTIYEYEALRLKIDEANNILHVQVWYNEENTMIRDSLYLDSEDKIEINL